MNASSPGAQRHVKPHSHRVWTRVLVALAGLAFTAAGIGVSRASRTTTPATATQCAELDHSHAAWTSLLERYVHDGVVDYARIHRDARPELTAYLDALGSVCRADYEAWTAPQQLAFWINAYNAYTVQLILDHYPVASIRDIGLLPGGAFASNFVALHQLRGGAVSLNEIEHEILRREFREPRIHVAIVCASESCPALRSEAYRAADLDAQLDEMARGFVRDPSKNRLDAATGTLWLSPIFDWFGEDFERDGGSVVEWVARYATPDVAEAIGAGGLDVKFLDYDWSLNGR